MINPYFSPAKTKADMPTARLLLLALLVGLGACTTSSDEATLTDNSSEAADTPDSLTVKRLLLLNNDDSLGREYVIRYPKVADEGFGRVNNDLMEVVTRDQAQFLNIANSMAAENAEMRFDFKVTRNDPRYLSLAMASEWAVPGASILLNNNYNRVYDREQERFVTFDDLCTGGNTEQCRRAVLEAIQSKIGKSLAEVQYCTNKLDQELLDNFTLTERTATFYIARQLEGATMCTRDTVHVPLAALQ